MTLKDWCLRQNPREQEVDERKLIQFGLIQGLVRKVNGYPVFSGKNYQSRTELEIDCNGLNTLEDLAVIHRVSLSHLEHLIAERERIVIVWK